MCMKSGHCKSRKPKVSFNSQNPKDIYFIMTWNRYKRANPHIWEVGAKEKSFQACYGVILGWYFWFLVAYLWAVCVHSLFIFSTLISFKKLDCMLLFPPVFAQHEHCADMLQNFWVADMDATHTIWSCQCMKNMWHRIERGVEMWVSLQCFREIWCTTRRCKTHSVYHLRLAHTQTGETNKDRETGSCKPRKCEARK